VGAAAVALSCLDEPSGPAAVPAYLTVAPSFASATASIVPLGAANVRLTRSSGTVALDTTVSISPADSTVDLNLTVVVVQTNEVFQLTITLRDTTGAQVFTAGPLAVTPSMNPGTAPVIDASFRYVGQGAGAASVEITTSYAVIAPGDSVLFEAVVLDSSGAEIPGTPIVWTSGNQYAQVPRPDRGLVVAGEQVGQAEIIATLLTGQADTVFPFIQQQSGNVLIVSNCDACNAATLDSFSVYMPGLTFDTLTVYSAVPTLAFLQQFTTVLLYEDGIFSNAVNVGDTVAAYVASGGNVVIGTFYWQEQPEAGYNGVGWGELDALDPFQTIGGSEYNADSLDVTSVVAHPLTAGVTALYVSSYHGGVAAKEGTTVLAAWSDGVPLIGYRIETGGQRLVSVSVYPGYPYYGGFSGDFYRLWENALSWAGAAPAPRPAPLAGAPVRRSLPVSGVSSQLPRVGGSESGGRRP
jgi:hypothetical protein